MDGWNFQNLSRCHKIRLPSLTPLFGLNEPIWAPVSPYSATWYKLIDLQVTSKRTGLVGKFLILNENRPDRIFLSLVNFYLVLADWFSSFTILENVPRKTLLVDAGSCAMASQCSILEQRVSVQAETWLQRLLQPNWSTHISTHLVIFLTKQGWKLYHSRHHHHRRYVCRICFPYHAAVNKLGTLKQREN